MTKGRTKYLFWYLTVVAELEYFQNYFGYQDNWFLPELSWIYMPDKPKILSWKEIILSGVTKLNNRICLGK